MSTHKCDNVSVLIDEIINSGFLDDCQIVCDYDNATQVIREFLKKDEIIPEYIELSNPRMGDYANEYLISVYNNELYCEQAKHGEKYLSFDNNIALMLGDVSKECLNSIDANTAIINVDFTDDDCDNVETLIKDNSSIYVSRDEDGNPIGVSRFWSFGDDNSEYSYTLSFFSNIKEDVESVLNIIEDSDSLGNKNK